MDSIPWEKAQLAAEEKPLRYGKSHPVGFEEHRAARWMRRMKRIFGIADEILDS